MNEHQGAISAATEYMRGLSLKKQIRQLSNRELAVKFERPITSIRSIDNGGHPDNISEAERLLIAECQGERKRLEGIYKGYTTSAVIARFHVSRRTLQAYVEDWQELTHG